MHEKNRVTVNPYLTFAGNCREAMTFYKEALNGDLQLLPFEGSPVEVPYSYKNNIMHATLRFGDAVIMASDSMPDQEVSHGNGVHISISVNDPEKAKQFFNNLSKGGKVVMPFDKTFWDALFGMCIDKFGVSWMVNCQLDQQ